MTKSKWNRFSRKWIPLVSIFTVVIAGCDSSQLNQSLDGGDWEKRAAYSGTAALEFEAVSPWTSPNGTLNSSSLSSEGSASLEVQSGYYTEVVASELDSPTSVGDSLKLDVRTSIQHSWGTIRIVLTVPSQGIYWSTIGTANLQGLAPNTFQEVDFPLSEDLKNKIAQSSGDIELRIILSSVPSTFWLDNGRIEGTDSPLSSCADGELNGGEILVDCGGECGPCGPSAEGILWYDKFTEGLDGWTSTGFTTAALIHDVDYAESGSRFPAATGSGAATLTSPPINLTGAVGAPILRFHRLIDAPDGTSTLLRVNANGSWHTVRNLADAGGNDGRWRTEFIQLGNYSNSSSFQFQIVTSGAETAVQVDDVSIEDRAAVDNTYAPHDYLLVPGNAGPGAHAWDWRTNATDPWEPARSGPFDSNNGTWANGSPPSDMFLRTTINIDSSEDLSRLGLWASWDDQLDIRVNGTLVAQETSWSSSYHYLATASNVFIHGANTIEVHAHDFGGRAFVDVGITRTPMSTSVPESFVQPVANADIDHFRTLLRDYAATRAVPGMAFSLIKDGRQILDAAYGYHDRAQTTPMPVNPVMRLASADKSYTIAAAERLTDGSFTLLDGSTLNRNTAVFPTLQNSYGFPVPLNPGDFSQVVTVGQLMDHMAHVRNFNEGGTGDYFSTIGSYSGHTTRHDNAIYINRRGCFRAPDTGGDQYNNGGYMLLRYFMDEVLKHGPDDTTRNGLQHYLQTQIQDDVFIDHESLMGRHPTEPWYATGDVPYDRWINLEHYTGLGATPRSLAELATNYHLISGEQVPYGGQTSGCEVRTGGINGTAAFGVQCERNLAFAVIFNGHQNIGSFYDVVPLIRSYALSLSDADYLP